MDPAAGNLISADSHVTEPSDLWVSRIDRAFRDRAPHYVHDASGGGLLFLIDGQIPKPVNVNIAVGQRPEDYREFFAKGLEAAPPPGRTRGASLPRPWGIWTRRIDGRSSVTMLRDCTGSGSRIGIGFGVDVPLPAREVPRGSTGRPMTDHEHWT